MHITSGTKQILCILALYFFLAWSLTGVYFFTHTQQIPDDWEHWHEQIGAGTAPDSSQFRLISYWLADGASKPFGQPVFIGYLSVRFVFTFITLCLFHLFLLKWMRPVMATFSVVLFAALTPISFIPFLQEADIVLYPFFLGGLWFIREQKFWWLAGIIAAGTFAKETIIFLLPMFALYQWRRGRTWRTIVETALLAIIWAAAFYVTRHVFFEGNNSPLWQLPANISFLSQSLALHPLINVYLFFIPVFGVFWILPFMRLSTKPMFLQRAAPYIVIFTTLHFLMGWPHETRIMLPLAFLIIPSGLMTLFPDGWEKNEVAPQG
ncbi:MAG: hypothetical protein HZC01_02505 [Candidatus Kerfeldbacteria bacterium]|nr:hypothetical protein [Candidatus Kerfeldbacteria bacterium]